MSKYQIAVTAENQKPVFLIKKGKKVVGRFTGTLHTTGKRHTGSAFSAIVMRIVSGFSVNVIGSVIAVETASIVGNNSVTKWLRFLSQFYTTHIPLTVEHISMYLEREDYGNAEFVDEDGYRINGLPRRSAKKYKVSYSKFVE
jgi:hypothetical protein